MEKEQICVMVTGVGGDIGQRTLRCLRESGYNIRLLGCDIEPYAAGRAIADAFFLAPRADDHQNYLAFIADLVDKQGVEYIYPISEAERIFFNNNRDLIPKSLVVLLCSKYIIDTFSDKYKTVQFLRNAGLPYPVTFRLEEYNNQLDFPVIIKNRAAYGGRGLLKVESLEELEFYRKRITNAIVQEYLENDNEEYTVGVFSDSQRVFSICFRRYLGYGSMSKFVELVHSKELRRIAEAIAERSKLEGSINVQFRKTSKGYVPFEVNPRLSSTVYFRHCFGFQDAKWWLDLKLGIPIEYKPKYQTGIGVTTVGEVFFEMGDIK